MTNSLGNKEKMAANIRRFLQVKGMTQTELAEAIGVPATTVFNWCQAATYPRIDKIELMANFFGCSKVDLVEDPEDVKAAMLDKTFGDRADLKTLFKIAENATPEDVQKAIRILDALMGEAVVIANDRLKKDFRYMIKQNGGMFAKGRLLGLQFDVLMQDDLYMKYSRHAIAMAKKIIAGFAEAGIPRYSNSPTNQQFFVMEDGMALKLAKKYGFSTEGWTDDTHRIVRFCTSWATKEENVEKLLADIKKLA